MEIEKFENEFQKLKEDIRDGEEISIIEAEDIKDKDGLSIFVDGKEIKDKTMYLVCINLNNGKE